MKTPSLLRLLSLAFCVAVLGVSPRLHAAGATVFNVRDYGATGQQADDARPSIQRAIDACAAAGGGTVYLPPGAYTSGTLRLRSHLRFEIEAGATLFASTDPGAYDFGTNAAKAALLYGENLEGVTLEGRGTVDGQAEYEWREDDFESGFNHKLWMQQLGKSLLRSVPKGFPKREVFPHLVYLGQVKDARITGLNFRHSPSWSLALYDCERAVFDGLYIYTSLREAVWADGIDLDGCKEVAIANCTITTGDDCIALSSFTHFGPARLCENITVNNCRLSSASAGLKFAEGNRVGIRRVLVSNTVFTHVNRGVVFFNGAGGQVSDVLISDCVIECDRFDWFWAGDGQPFFFRLAPIAELNQEPAKPGDPPPGTIRNVTIRNVIARAKGSSPIHGHATSPLEGITFDGVKLFVSTDPVAPYDKAEHALDFRRVTNLKVRHVEVFWEPPALQQWQSALSFEDVRGLELDGFEGRAAWPERDGPAVVFKNVADARVRDCRALAGTRVFLKVTGAGSRGIRLHGNDLSQASVPYQLDKGVKRGAVK